MTNEELMILLEESYKREARHLKRIDKLVDQLTDITIDNRHLKSKYSLLKAHAIKLNEQLSEVKPKKVYFIPKECYA